MGLLPQAELHEILRQFKSVHGSNASAKVTFAGGEPTLSPTFLEDVTYAKSLGLMTSVVTNGSLLTDQLLGQLKGVLDLLTLSIDSINTESNLEIGRSSRQRVLSPVDYLDRIKTAQGYGIAVKVNTVVNRVNVDEDMAAFICEVNPIRWKLFKVLRIEGENGSCYANWTITDKVFADYVARHQSVEQAGIALIPETNEQMYGTYAFISPDGRFIDDTQGEHRYSQRIVDVGIEQAFSEVTFSMAGFEQRGGVYSI